jgi:hypothetical protein
MVWAKVQNEHLSRAVDLLDALRVILLDNRGASKVHIAERHGEVILPEQLTSYSLRLFEELLRHRYVGHRQVRSTKIEVQIRDTRMHFAIVAQTNIK